MSHFRYPGEAEPDDKTALVVQTVAPDELVALGQIRPPDLIKVDVQGHGASALEGSLVSIRAKLPVIIFSSHSPTELSGARELLDPLGYSVERLTGDSMGWDDLESETGILLPRSRATPGGGKN